MSYQEGEYNGQPKKEIPRLVVSFKVEDGNEMYQWGVVGQIPILSLIGAIGQIQIALALQNPSDNIQEGNQLVIFWDNEKKQFSYLVDHRIPIESLCGMLETIKATIVSTHLARQIASQQVILGPDGQPMRR